MKTTIFILSILLLTGCKTKELIYVPVEKMRIEYRDNYVRDSIFHYDSVYVKEKGDTVLVEKYRYIYRDVLKRDSIYVHDSIPVPYPVEIIKEKTTNRLTWLQQTQVYVGMAAMIAIIGYFVIKYKTKWISFFLSIIKKL